MKRTADHLSGATQESRIDFASPPLWHRSIARGLDLVLYGGTAILVVWILISISGAMAEGSCFMWCAGRSGWGWVLAFYLSLLLVLPAPVVVPLVFEVFMQRRIGASPGKRLMGLCVVAVRQHTGPVAPDLQFLLRRVARWAAVFLVPSALVWPAVAYIANSGHSAWAWPHHSVWTWAIAIGMWPAVMWLPVLFNRDRRGSHDLLAGTMVISARDLPPGDPLRSEPWLSGLLRGAKQVPYWLKLTFCDVWKRQQR